ncbi:hypothetical protein [Tahibacter sp.]|uniref:hypothetical protein n=1 Tax=Tahibacter sp. TaxID=2056211 RepID=UPI0028C39738|nr:hypothetical protein [Tahibacter sp.]
MAAIPGIELVDRTTISAYIDSNDDSIGPLATSAGGRFTLFASAATNLVSDDTNGVSDIFVHDASDDSLERVSVASDGSEANAASGPFPIFTQRGGISSDGRYVVFQSQATDLVAEPTGGQSQVYRRDRIAGTTTLISRGTDGLPAAEHVFLGASTPDGRYTVFATSAGNFPNSDNHRQVYRYDANDSSLIRVTVSFDGQPTYATEDNMEISDDGRFVLFSSFADNVLPGGAPLTYDLFLRDLQAGTTQQVTVTDAGAPAVPPFFQPDFPSSIGLLSGDGRYTVFTTNALLSAADTDVRDDVYRFDRLSGTTTLISTEVGGVTPLGINRAPSVSADGSRILFASLPLNGSDPSALFIRDMAAGTLASLAVPPARFSLDANLVLARDGSEVFINARDLPPRNGFRHIHRFDIGSGLLTRLSRAGAFSVGPYANGPAEAMAAPSPSADGTLVAFASEAGNLVTGDTNGVSDIFVRDRSGATTERISLRANGTESPCASASATLTPDARYVVFASCGALAAPASGEQSEVYRYDRTLGTMALVSIGMTGSRAEGASFEPHVSSDGRYVAFGSCASNLVPPAGGNACQIYLRDMDAGTTVLVSRSSAGTPASTGFNADAFVSGDGRFIGYTSAAPNLVANDTNGSSDAFVFDRVMATTERISVSAIGAQGNSSSSFRGFDQIANLAVFESLSSNFSIGGGIETRSYLRNRGAATTTLIAIPGDERAAVLNPTVSLDGRFVAFIGYSADSGVSAVDDTNQYKLFVLDRNDGSYRALTWFTQATQVSEAKPATREPRLSADGRSIAFVSARADLTSDDGNGAFSSIFIAHLDDAIFKSGFE